MTAVDSMTGNQRWSDEELVSATGSDVLIARRLVHDDETGDVNFSTVGIDSVTGSFLWDTRDAVIGPVVDGVAYLTIYGVLRRIPARREDYVTPRLARRMSVPLRDTKR